MEDCWNWGIGMIGASFYFCAGLEYPVILALNSSPYLDRVWARLDGSNGSQVGGGGFNCLNFQIVVTS